MNYGHIVLFLLFVIGFMSVFIIRDISEDKVTYETKSRLYNHDYNKKNELIRIVYIGSPNCVFSNNAENHQNISKIKDIIDNWGQRNDMDIIHTAIAVNTTREEAFNYFEKTGEYEEVITNKYSYNSYNLGFLQLVWSESFSFNVTPTIIITKIKFDITRNSLIGYNSINRSERMLSYYSGKDEINDYKEYLKKKDFNLKSQRNRYCLWRNSGLQLHY